MIQKGLLSMQITVRATNNKGSPFESLKLIFVDDSLDITNTNFCNQVSPKEVACCYIISQSDTEVREVVFQLDLDVPTTSGLTSHKVSAIK